MAKQFVSLRNLKFMLHEVFNVEQLTKYPYFQDYDKEAFNMMLDATMLFAENIMLPSYQEMDRQQAEFEDGKVTVHASVKTIMKTAGENGWISASNKFEDGGMQLPHSVRLASSFINMAANNHNLFTGLTAGSANLIVSFGTQELKDKFVPNMFAGKWQGTMCLTEPQAGSSLSDITTIAFPQPDNSYKIKGQKIFISAGDHDQAENFIHLVLARIEGAPLGTKGISLFVVPKFRIKDNGETEYNDVATAGLFHKMGQKGVPAAHLTFGDKDDCIGYLVGEENKGLSYMFQMMNEARLGVGLIGVAIASAAYYAALEYAQERPQGRRLSEEGDKKDNSQSKIIEHAYVRRMLLFQKAVVEGSLGLIMECGLYEDLSGVATDEAEKEKYHLLLDLLTPIVSQAMQCLGGYGYCEDFPVEQMYRDIRITPIYEGTTGIQSMDLLGRKVTMKGGKAVMLLAGEIQKTLKEASAYDDLKRYISALQDALMKIQQVTQHLVAFAMKGEHEVFLADATLYMEFFSLITISWQWLKQAVVAKQALLSQNPQGDEADFYESKIHTMKYFFVYELPKINSLATTLMDEEMLTIAKEKATLV